ncbi:MAG: cell division protein ZapB [Treponema sp.]
MISLDQVLLLEKKVESAVAKIQQLQAENDALRKKCDELTNSLSSKSELLSSFESDQNQIENGIKNALDRLSSIENTVLETFSSLSNQQTNIGQVQSSKTETNRTEQNNSPMINSENPNDIIVNQQDVKETPNLNDVSNQNLNSPDDFSNVKFDDMDDLSSQNENNSDFSDDLFNASSQAFENVQGIQKNDFQDYEQISEETYSDESDDDLSFDIF